MSRRREPCLLLKRVPFGESSLVVHALGPRSGRVHFLVKGAYRPKSPLCGLFDAFDTLELEWNHRPGRDLQTVHKGDILVRRRHVAEHGARYRAAWTLLELAGLAALPDAPDARLFQRLSVALDRLEAGAPHDATLAVFALGFLDGLGLAPALVRCAACRKAAPAVDPAGKRAVFSAGAGGRLCASCAHEARTSGRRVGTLPVAVLELCARLARELRASGIEALQRAHAEAEALEPALAIRARDFLERFLAFHLQTTPRSNRAFLAAPNRNAPAAGADVAHGFEGAPEGRTSSTRGR